MSVHSGYTTEVCLSFWHYSLKK